MDRFDKLADDISEIKVQLTKNTSLLERNVDELSEHKRRTLANEQRIDIVEKFVERHANIKQFVFMVGACMAGIAGFIYSVVRIIEFFA